jgi:hypothetical protein
MFAHAGQRRAEIDHQPTARVRATIAASRSMADAAAATVSGGVVAAVMRDGASIVAPAVLGADGQAVRAWGNCGGAGRC